MIRATRRTMTAPKKKECTLESLIYYSDDETKSKKVVINKMLPRKRIGGHCGENPNRGKKKNNQMSDGMNERKGKNMNFRRNAKKKKLVKKRAISACEKKKKIKKWNADKPTTNAVLFLLLRSRKCIYSLPFVFRDTK